MDTLRAWTSRVLLPDLHRRLYHYHLGQEFISLYFAIAFQNRFGQWQKLQVCAAIIEFGQRCDICSHSHWHHTSAQLWRESWTRHHTLQFQVLMSILQRHGCNQCRNRHLMWRQMTIQARDQLSEIRCQGEREELGTP